MLKHKPAVFLVGKHYQIIFEVTRETLSGVRVGKTLYWDETNGVMNTLCNLHRVTVPQAALERAGGYTLCLRPVVERKPYFSETEELQELSFSFTPAPRENLRAFLVADAHNRVDQPVAAAEAFGKIDVLFLGGDLIEYSSAPEKFEVIYQLCSRLTGGELPCVFARGNHDMRGTFAERFSDYTPTDSGLPYFTFRLGSLWGLVLDCGEDKNDDRPEYGNTIACHGFRLRQTAFLKGLIARAAQEYEAPGITTRIVLVHTPFPCRFEPPFDIEQALYHEWTSLISRHVRPDLYLCGHTHRHGVIHPNDPQDAHGLSCPLVVGCEPREESFVGCGLEFLTESIRATFTDSRDGVLSQSEFVRAPRDARKESAAGPASEAARLAAFENGLGRLTPAEQAVLSAHLARATTEELLENLHITKNTLKYHNKNLYGKLGVTSKGDLLRLAKALSLSE